MLSNRRRKRLRHFLSLVASFVNREMLQTVKLFVMSSHWQTMNAMFNNEFSNEGFSLMALNGQVLLQVGYFITSSPELKPNKEIKVQDNN